MNTPEEEKINARIEEVRLTTGLTATDFAKKIGVKPNTYLVTVNYSRRKPGIELLQAILRTFKVSPRWLLLGEGFMWDIEKIQQLGNEQTLIETARAILSQISQKGTG